MRFGGLLGEGLKSLLTAGFGSVERREGEGRDLARGRIELSIEGMRRREREREGELRPFRHRKWLHCGRPLTGQRPSAAYLSINRGIPGEVLMSVVGVSQPCHPCDRTTPPRGLSTFRPKSGRRACQGDGKLIDWIFYTTLVEFSINRTCKYPCRGWIHFELLGDY